MRAAPLDAARTLVCALVVLAHVDIWLRAGVRSWWPGGEWAVPVLGVAVPTFLVLSGLSFPRWRPGSDARAYVGRKVRQLVIPFLAWNAITLMLMPTERATSGRALLNLLTGTWHLYFLFALLQLMALAWAIDRVGGRAGSGAVLLVALLGSAAIYLWSDVLVWARGGDGLLFEVTIRKFAPVWAGFFALGLWLRDRPGLPGRAAWWLWAPAAAGYVTYLLALRAQVDWLGYATRLQFIAGGLAFQVLGPLLLLGGLQQLQRLRAGRRAVSVLARPSRYTFAVYLAHAPFILIFTGLAARGGVHLAQTWAVPLMWLAAGGAAILAAIVLRRTPLAPLLWGQPRARSRRRATTPSRPATEPRR